MPQTRSPLHRPARPGRDPDPSGRRLVVGGRRRRAAGAADDRAPVFPRRPSKRLRAQLRSREPTALLLGGGGAPRTGLGAAAGIAAATGAELLAETFAARVERGAGIPEIQRLAYFGEMAAGQLEGLRHLILVDARSPVSFFAYPGKPSDLVPRAAR